jgi:hypothetical protein
MMARLLLLLVSSAWMACAQGAEEKAILEVVPSLAELGEGWTTNVVAYLIDPRSHPSEIDYQCDAKASPRLAEQREAMKTNCRTGCGMVFYGRGGLVMNGGLYRVTVQRWSQIRPLHNTWVAWKMNPCRVVRSYPAVGEDFFWVNQWWRATLVQQDLVFLRGRFHVVIEAGADADLSQAVRLAQAIDAKIRGRPVPKPAVSTSTLREPPPDQEPEHSRRRRAQRAEDPSHNEAQ